MNVLFGNVPVAIVVVVGTACFMWQAARCYMRNLAGQDTRPKGSAAPVFWFVVASVVAGAFDRFATSLAQGGFCFSPGSWPLTVVVPLFCLSGALAVLSFTSVSVPDAEDPVAGRMDFQSECRERQVAELYSVLPEEVATENHYARVYLFSHYDVAMSRGYTAVLSFPALLLLTRAACFLKGTDVADVALRIANIRPPLVGALFVFALCAYPVWHQYSFLKSVWMQARSRFVNKHVLVPFLRFAAYKQVKPFMVMMWIVAVAMLALTASDDVLHTYRTAAMYAAAGALAATLHFYLLKKLLKEVQQDEIESSLYVHTLRKRLAEAEKKPLPLNLQMQRKEGLDMRQNG